MDIAFNCDKCGQHIVIDEAGAGMTVPCPSCNQNLTVPKKTEDVKKPDMTVNLGSSIQQLADLIDTGLMEDDAKLDAFFDREDVKTNSAVWGEAVAQAYQRGEITSRELLNAGTPLMLEEFESINKWMEDAGFGKKPANPLRKTTK